MLHASCCNEAIKPLVLLCDLCHSNIKAHGILNVDLAVMDRTSELSNPFLGFVIVGCRLW